MSYDLLTVGNLKNFIIYRKAAKKGCRVIWSERNLTLRIILNRLPTCVSQFAKT